MKKDKDKKEGNEVPEKKLKNQDDNQALIEEIEEDKKREQKKGFVSHLLGRMGTEKVNIFRGGVGSFIDEYKLYKERKGQLIEKYGAYETVVAGSTDTIEYYIRIRLLKIGLRCLCMKSLASAFCSL